MPVGLAFGMCFPAGPASLPADQSGILNPVMLWFTGIISGFAFLYSIFFAFITLLRDEEFFDWVETHPPFFKVLVIVEWLALLPVGGVAAVSVMDRAFHIST